MFSFAHFCATKELARTTRKPYLCKKNCTKTILILHCLFGVKVMAINLDQPLNLRQGIILINCKYLQNQHTALSTLNIINNILPNLCSSLKPYQNLFFLQYNFISCNQISYKLLFYNQPKKLNSLYL